jgi:hypothetical protein
MAGSTTTVHVAETTAASTRGVIGVIDFTEVPRVEVVEERGI